MISLSTSDHPWHDFLTRQPGFGTGPIVRTTPPVLDRHVCSLSLLRVMSGADCVPRTEDLLSLGWLSWNQRTQNPPAIDDHILYSSKQVLSRIKGGPWRQVGTVPGKPGRGVALYVSRPIEAAPADETSLPLLLTSLRRGRKHPPGRELSSSDVILQ